jgi:hypothetical protein
MVAVELMLRLRIRAIFLTEAFFVASPISLCFSTDVHRRSLTPRHVALVASSCSDSISVSRVTNHVTWFTQEISLGNFGFFDGLG